MVSLNTWLWFHGTVTNLALVGFLYNLGYHYKLGSFLFISVTSKLNSFFRNDVFSDTILSTALVAFVYVDGMLLNLFRPSSLIKT